jgi:hypothetical protein
MQPYFVSLFVQYLRRLIDEMHRLAASRGKISCLLSLELELVRTVFW